jgi:membrane protein required for colicin V production
VNNVNGVDIFFLVVVLLFSALGFYWGFIRQVLSLAGLLTGIVLASRYGASVANLLTPFVHSDTVASSLGFIIVLLAVSAVASLLASMLRRFVGLLFLGWLDHIGGALLGFIQAILLCVVLVAVAATFPNALWADSLRNSQFALALLRGFGFILALLPEQYRVATELLFGLP